jgi:signal transduction histidine kinase
LETVYRNSEELLELIDNVLWMTSLNAGDAAATVEKFDGCEIVGEAVKRYERILREKGLALSVEVADTGMSMVSDRSKVERIFQNVFNNAIKFTSQGEIKVRAHPMADHSSIQFEVIDTGIGIEKNKMDSIFEPFQQVDTSTHRSFSGLGLGLTVARRMAELIGGTLEISSEAGKGTHVLMKFPTHVGATAALVTEQRKYG